MHSAFAPFRAEADCGACRPKGEALVKALQQQNWDPGMKSLVPFPQAVAAMNETWKGPSSLATRLQTNRRLSRLDQRLRRSAQKAGSLKTTEQQRVIWSAGSRGSASTKRHWPGKRPIA